MKRREGDSEGMVIRDRNAFPTWVMVALTVAGIVFGAGGVFLEVRSLSGDVKELQQEVREGFKAVRGDIRDHDHRIQRLEDRPEHQTPAGRPMSAAPPAPAPTARSSSQ